MADMKLSSPEFNEGEFIPKKYSCEGADISPPLNISGAPEDAKSLALIVDDPDAPSGTWVHWVVWNIMPSWQIGEGSVPEGGMQGKNDFGKMNYGGPCPPSGPAHRYYFKLYALDTELELSPGATKEELLSAMEGHILAQAQIMGKYKK